MAVFRLQHRTAATLACGRGQRLPHTAGSILRCLLRLLLRLPSSCASVWALKCCVTSLGDADAFPAWSRVSIAWT